MASLIPAALLSHVLKRPSAAINPGVIAVAKNLSSRIGVGIILVALYALVKDCACVGIR